MKLFLKFLIMFLAPLVDYLLTFNHLVVEIKTTKFFVLFMAIQITYSNECRIKKGDPSDRP